MKYWHPVSVRSYAGYRRDETPRTIRWDEIVYEVSRVLRFTSEQTLDRQRIRRFHVFTTTEQELMLVQDVELNKWYVETED